MKNKIIFFVNDINFFVNHFLPLSVRANELHFETLIVSNKIDKDIIKLYPQIEQRAINIDRSSVNPFIELKTIFQFYKILNQYKPNIVHNFSIKPILYGSFLGRFFFKKIKFVNSVTGLGYAFTNDIFLVKNIIKLLIRICVPKNNMHLIFLNKHDKKLYQSLGRLNDGNYNFINGSGVDNYDFPYISPKKKEKLNLTFTGRILKDKGILELIEAVNILPSELKARIILNIYGKIDIENPAFISEEELKKLLRPNFILWHGFSKNIKKVLMDSDIYCLPSYREGIPKSTIEAMAIGRPILTTNAPGCDNTVKEGINGFKVSVGDANALSIKLQTLIENKTLRIQMGKNSRIFFEEEFTLEKVIKQTFKVYNKVLQNRVV